MDDERIIEWERLVAFLSSPDVADPADVRVDLEAQGVNVDHNVQLIRTMVRQQFQAQLRETAQKQRAVAVQRVQETIADVAAWPIEKVRQWISDAHAGSFGTDVSGLAAAFHRGKEDKDLTEAEARSLIADILFSKK